MWKRVIGSIFLFLLWMVIAVGQTPPSEEAAPPQLTDEMEQEAKSIEQLIVSPCCWTSPVSDHYSGAAWEVRGKIRELLAEGKNRQEVLDYYVEQHGRKILSAPENSGFDSLAYSLPLVFLIAGAILAGLIIHKLRVRGVKSDGAPSEAKIDQRYADLLEKEMME